MSQLAMPENFSDDQTLLTIDDVMRRLRVGRTAVYKLLQEGRLEKVKLEKSTRITGRSLRRLFDEITRNGNER